MKSLNFFLSLIIFSLISCSTSETPPAPVEPEVVLEDTYNYIVLRHDGQLFEVGDNTGKIKTINKIPGIELLSAINAVANSASMLYMYEHKFPPSQPLIHEYNLATKTSKSHVIEFPEEAFGPYPGLVSLEWVEENKMFIALVKEKYGENSPVSSRLAQIDPETFKVTPMNIEVDRGHIMSTLKKGNYIYASSYRSSSTGVHDFFRIDLQSGQINSLEVDGMTIAPIHLSHNPDKNTLFGFLPVQGSSFMGASRPIIINPTTGVVKQLLPDEQTGNFHQFGRSFFNSETKEHVDFITSMTYNALFRYNSNTSEVQVIKLPHPNNLGTGITIVGVVKL